MLGALPDAGLMIDARGNLAAANALAAEVFGFAKIGRPLSATTRHPDLPGVIARASKNGDRVAFELSIRSPIERRLDGTATRIAGLVGLGTAPHVLIILQDTTERDALSRMRMEFVANASHELRTPLAALSGFIETLHGPARDDPEARQRFLGIMAEQAGRMTRLIDDLLLLSRVEMRAHLPPSGTVDLNELAADAVRQLTSNAQVEGLTVHLEPFAQPVRVVGEHDELLQAAYNLVHNAIKYSRTGGSIKVQTRIEPDPTGHGARAILAVADDGPGIAREHIPRLTERFYRVSTSASRAKGGTGLGLAIVKHIATRHRGSIQVTSEVGRGSIFTLEFPILASDRLNR
jgi:two-component system, OmpR family, phosphate regulon sensor histidine kinase PhoR